MGSGIKTSPIHCKKIDIASGNVPDGLLYFCSVIFVVIDRKKTCRSGFLQYQILYI